MKNSLLVLVLGSLVGLAGCQTSQVAQQSDARQFEVAGIQGRTTVTIPENRAASNESAYALRGNGETPAASADRAKQGTNHM